MTSPAVGWHRVGTLFQIAVLAAATLSCGDSGTGPESDETPPSVLSTDPAAGANGAARSAAVQATFSEPIAPATVTAMTFTVTGDGAVVSGTVSASGSVARWTPDAPLVSGTQYTATLSTGITDMAGNALATSVSWTFSANSAPTIAMIGEVDANRGEQVTLDASGSTDPDGGQTLSFVWTQVSGPTVTLSSATAPAPTFTAPDAISTLAFDLVVSDGADEATQRVGVWVLENEASHFWVSPETNGAWLGTRAQPFPTIMVAVNAANVAGLSGDVYVAAGSYDGSITLSSGVSIYGGYDPATFVRDIATHETEIIGNSVAVGGVELSGTDPVTLNGLTIRAADIITSNGAPSIGIRLGDSPNVIISDNRIFAGAAGDGWEPAPAPDGADGSAGAFGTNASAFCADLPGGAGGSGPSSANARGGTGGQSGAGGFRGSASEQWNGGAGGAGGGYPGGNGGHGVAATVGTQGEPGTAFGTVTNSGEYISSDGGPGYTAFGGSGGGGGGGGGGAVFACGGSGGGGGAGGAGGVGGAGGKGGGGSFGIVVAGTSTDVVIVNNEITTSNGGQGSDGGAGGAGGAGGPGRTGGNGTADSGAGGRGGNGGAGGAGGAGGGGGGGPSVGVVVAGGASTNLTAADLAGNTVTLGMAGSGGRTGDISFLTAPDGLRIDYTRR